MNLQSANFENLGRYALSVALDVTFTQTKARFASDWSKVKQVLTHTAKPLFAEPDEHVEAEVAISRTVEVFQSPQMIAILFHVLL